MAYRILLVEDEIQMRLTLVEVLQQAGYDVVEAVNGDEACTLIHSVNGFDVLLTDIQMPGMADGIDVAQHFQAEHPDKPVVFMTGRPEILDRIGALRQSEALIPKPFRAGQMLDALHGLLTRTGQSRAEP